MPAVSVIATAYNQLRYLKLLLASLERQTFRDFELVIADDGSSDGTAAFCRSYGGLQLKLVTQEDAGYRKARILNEAIHAASADYLVFVDSDVILQSEFLADHLALRAAGSFVCGRRVDLGPVFSQGITEEQVREGSFDSPSPALLMSGFRGDTQNWKRALRIPDQKLRKLLKYDRPIDILGSNMSMWKKDLLEINGFNEALESYWGEDGDLFIRLRNSGKKAIGAKGMCVQYHVFHPRREPSKENMDKVYALLQNTTYKWAEKGYDSRF